MGQQTKLSLCQVSQDFWLLRSHGDQRHAIENTIQVLQKDEEEGQEWGRPTSADSLQGRSHDAKQDPKPPITRLRVARGYSS